MSRDITIPGAFIVLEGLDGAGTTTQCALLTDWCERQGYHTIATREPTDGPWGKQARAALKGETELSPLALAFTFMADRAHHIAHLAQQATEQTVIVSDRYLFSYLAYQQIDAAKPLSWFVETAKPLPLPDLTIYVDVSPERCVARLQMGRAHVERFERLGTLQKVYAAYQTVFTAYDGQHSTLMIDGDQPIEIVHGLIIDAVEAMLAKRASSSE